MRARSVDEPLLERFELLPSFFFTANKCTFSSSVFDTDTISLLQVSLGSSSSAAVGPVVCLKNDPAVRAGRSLESWTSPREFQEMLNP